GSGTPRPAARSRIEQIAPPLDLKTPPADATTTTSGLIVKRLVRNDAGAQPKRNDTVMIQFTGWSQRTGETFNTTRGRGQPQGLPLHQAAPGFVEGLQLMHQGERAMLWIPPAIGYVRPPTGTPETLVYEVELVDIQPAPAVPPDVAAPPATAIALPSGTRYVVLTPGTGTKARSFDSMTYTSTSWDAEGRMIDTMKRPANAPIYKQSVAFEEVLTTMTEGARVRFWVAADKRCTEVEIVKLQRGNEPPSVPADVAKMPDDVQKTPKGVGWKILRASTRKDAKHPLVTERVRVHYTGWTTDGRMFDSSVVRNEPSEFALNAGVIGGWTEGVPMMALGDKARLWVPEELAYKGAPGRPQGMLVFDIELLEIKPAPPPKPHGPG
ncbi:MAG: FKBP-type peptidyl-prolyl cis-trans isomerase, partial [Proteobacteria bacterium]|nr:FKBP-type peptidyl-prolyl cis-trans isomerase [Pseudomonadota bacterium]